jgi:Type II secretion system protein C
MNGMLRLALAACLWLAAAALGWWLQQPRAAAPPVVTMPSPAATAATPDSETSPGTMAARINAVDPMGLRSSMVSALAATLTAAAPAAPAQASWRLAALVVRGPERYAVLTSGEQPALKLRVGELLPDGDRIKAVHANHIEIQSPRGRLRTLYLIEP